MPGSVWKRWNWLELVLMPLASAVVRVAWMAPVIQLLLNNPLVLPRTPFPAWLILVLLIGGSLVRQAIQERPGWMWLSALVGLGVVLTVLAGVLPFPAQNPGQWLGALWQNLMNFRDGLPAPLLVLVITALLWRRGLLLDWSDYDDLWRSFVIGVVVLGIMLLLPTSLLEQAGGINMRLAMVSFLATGLLALALVAVAEALYYERAQGNKTPGLNRYWLVAVGSVILLLLLGGWLVGLLLSPGTLAELWRAIRPVLDLVLQGLFYVLVAIAYLIMLLLEPLLQRLKLRPAEQLKTFNERMDDLQKQFQEGEQATRGLPPGVWDALRVIVVVALVVLVVVLFLRITRTWRRKRAGVDEERELIFSRELLREQLQDLLRRKPQPGPPFLDLGGLEEPRRAIRLLYQRLLTLASGLGHPRPVAATPSAFQSILEGVLPTAYSALRTLTAAYHQARYAPEAPTPEQVAGAQQALEGIEGSLGGEEKEKGKR